MSAVRVVQRLSEVKSSDGRHTLDLDDLPSNPSRADLELLADEVRRLRQRVLYLELQLEDVTTPRTERANAKRKLEEFVAQQLEPAVRRAAADSRAATVPGTQLLVRSPPHRAF